jgi:hypothetical protein
MQQILLVVVVEPELGPQLLHAALELHERCPEPLDLLGGERAALDPAHGLALHQLAHEVDEHEHQSGEAALDVLGVGVDACRQAHAATKL